MVRRNPSAPFEFVDDRAVRPVVAVAGVGELSQRARNFRERLGAVLEVGHMCERERFHFGAGAAAVGPEAKQLTHLLDGEAEILCPPHELQPVITTPISSGMPKSRFSPIAVPITSAISVA